MVSIRYFDFWDVPRAFVAADSEGALLLSCRFDDGLDDFPDFYEVYSLPPLDETAYADGWDTLFSKVIKRLGSVAVSNVCFDSSRRQQVDLTGLRRAIYPN